MNDTNNSNNPIDLGSAPAETFDPFATDDELGDDSAEEVSATQSTNTGEETPASSKIETVTSDSSSANEAKSDNPLEAAVDAAETKEAEKAKQSIYEKPPVFEYAGAVEDINDSSQTFDELRIAKATDFPELEDGKRVSFTVEYGKITKTVSDTKGMTIAKMKSDIETSKEFLDGLKKAKDKNPVCKVKPKVTAQSKGTVTAASGYKGIFTNMEDSDTAGKVISILPARDGKVYEIRNNASGRFITPVGHCELLSDVRAGFTPAQGIPCIPRDMIMQIIAFFRRFAQRGDSSDYEALVNIYWDTCNCEFIADVPEQIVSKISVKGTKNPEYDNSRYIHYMDIHSHNNMKAFFSPIDDEDEKATGLYTVFGRINQFMPEIKTRISNGGKFLEIDPAEVFEPIASPFPEGWIEKVSFVSPFKGDKIREGDFL